MARNIDNELQVLLAEYNNGRQEHLTYLKALFSIVSFTIALLGVFIAIIYNIPSDDYAFYKNTLDLIFFILVPVPINLLLLILLTVFMTSEYCRTQLLTIEVTINKMLYDNYKTAPMFYEISYICKDRKFTKTRKRVPKSNDNFPILTIIYSFVAVIYILLVFYNRATLPLDVKYTYYTTLLVMPFIVFFVFLLGHIKHFNFNLEKRRELLNEVDKWNDAYIKNVFYDEYIGGTPGHHD